MNIALEGENRDIVFADHPSGVVLEQSREGVDENKTNGNHDDNISKDSKSFLMGRDSGNEMPDERGKQNKEEEVHPAVPGLPFYSQTKNKKADDEAEKISCKHHGPFAESKENQKGGEGDENEMAAVPCGVFMKIPRKYPKAVFNVGDPRFGDVHAETLVNFKDDVKNFLIKLRRVRTPMERKVAEDVGNGVSRRHFVDEYAAGFDVRRQRIAAELIIPEPLR